MTTLSAKVQVLTEAMGRLGFKKRRGLIFTIPLREDKVTGWIGLNTASRYGGNRGEVTLNPVVGVRHDEVEEVVARLRREKFHPYIPPTVSSTLRHIIPPGDRHNWIVIGDDAHDLDVAAKVSGAVENWGFEFMRKSENLQGVIAALQAGQGHVHQNAYRLPVALVLAGRTMDAERNIDDAVKGLGARTDLAALQFRDFAAHFGQWITSAGRS
jgi:hypothetical protein